MQKLDKPYAVMKKNTSKTAEEDDDVIMTTDGNNDVDDGETAYTVVAFVKQKIIFKNRPKPIIIKPQAKTV